MCLISGCLQPTQLSWLPVLSSVVPPSLCRKAATDNLLQIIKAHPNWPVYADVFEHPPSWLASQHPIWWDMTSVDTITQWRRDWSSPSVVNDTIVTDPTVRRQPGFHLPLHTRSLMNNFRTGQGPCHANVRQVHTRNEAEKKILFCVHLFFNNWQKVKAGMSPLRVVGNTVWSYMACEFP